MSAVQEILDNYVIKHGEKGKKLVSKAVGKTPRTIDRWRNDGIPDRHDAFKVAVACGIEENAALRLAREEALPVEAREPA